MKVFRSSEFPDNSEELYWFYNGMDCAVTHEVYSALDADLRAGPCNVRATYDMSMRKSAPYMLMSLRGIRVDEGKRQRALFDLAKDHRILTRNFDLLCGEMFGKTVSAASWQQVAGLLYDDLGLPGRHLGTGEKQLNKLMDRTIAQPFIKHILALRDANKQTSNLNASLDNGRFYTLLSVAGTKTRRLSSRKSNFGFGGNAQNIDSRHRGMFIPDEGYVAVEIDLEQADSRNVGAIIYVFLDDASYLDFCESGDLHTKIAEMAWPELPWPEDTRKYAESVGTNGAPQKDFQLTIRQIAKKSGHGTNFRGGPREIGLQVNVPMHVVVAFQKRYYAAVPCIPDWHEWTQDQLERHGQLTTLYGHQRDFHGRPDNQTLKQALSYQASSMTAHEIDHGVLAIFNNFEPEVQLLNQVHDSVWFQMREKHIDTLMPEILGSMEHRMNLGGRDFCVPLEAMYGESWGKEDMQAFSAA